MATHTEDFVVLAKLGKPHALKGWQLLQSYSATLEEIQAFECLYLQCPPQSEWQVIAPEGLRMQHNKLMIKLAEVDSPEQARNYTHAQLGVKRAQLPPAEQGSYYWHDLIGCQATNPHGDNLGTVDRVFNAGAQDILALQTDGSTATERLVPFADSIVLSVDLESKIIKLDWELDW